MNKRIFLLIVCIGVFISFSCDMNEQPDFIPGNYSGTLNCTAVAGVGTQSGTTYATYPLTIVVLADGTIAGSNEETVQQGSLSVTQHRTDSTFQNDIYEVYGTATIDVNTSGYSDFTGPYYIAVSQINGTTLSYYKTVNTTGTYLGYTATMNFTYSGNLRSN